MPAYEYVTTRFWRKVRKTDTCWLWTASLNRPGGYGQFGAETRPDGRRRIVAAHRFAWEITRGPVPDGLVLDHLCRNRLCVNPDHLEPVTVNENARRVTHPAPCPTGCSEPPQATLW